MPSRGVAGAITCSPRTEAQYEWKVENIFSLPGESMDWYDSPDFQFSGHTFKFLLYPNLWERRIKPELKLRAPGPPVTIRFTLGVKTVAGDTELWQSGTLKMSITTGFFFFKCMKRSELWLRREELAPRDALTFRVSLKIVSLPHIGTTEVAVQTTVEDAAGQEANGGRQALENTGTTEVAVQTTVDVGGHEANGRRQDLENTDLATVVQSLTDLYVAGKDCDVTLEVKDKKFRAHKLILGARTPVLAAMFSHNTTEAETGIVRVQDCHPEAFEIFLKFVYSGAAENLTGENVANVYYVADKYDLPGLKKECVRHMVSNLTTGSVCSVIDLAQRHGEELLQERATEFFVENAREIFHTASWRKLLAKNSNLANDLIIRGYGNSK